MHPWAGLLMLLVVGALLSTTAAPYIVRANALEDNVNAYKYVRAKRIPWGS